jgi:hypothetical protein
VIVRDVDPRVRASQVQIQRISRSSRSEIRSRRRSEVRPRFCREMSCPPATSDEESASDDPCRGKDAGDDADQDPLPETGQALPVVRVRCARLGGACIGGGTDRLA